MSTEARKPERSLTEWGAMSLRYFQDRMPTDVRYHSGEEPWVQVETYRLLGVNTVNSGRFTSINGEGRLKSIKIIAFPTATSVYDSDPVREHEAQALCYVNSRFVLPVEDSFTLLRAGEHFSYHALVSPYTPFGDAQAYLSNTKGRSVAESVAFLLEVLVGIVDLHKIGVVHGDLKPANVVFWRYPLAGGGEESPISAAITDFGSAVVGGAGGLRSATPAYAAPEVWGGERSSKASDMWSWGAIAFFALTGKECLGECFGDVSSCPDSLAWRASLTADVQRICAPSAIGDLILRALSIDREMRPSANDALRELAHCVAISDGDGVPDIGSSDPSRVLVADTLLSFVLRDYEWSSLRSSDLHLHVRFEQPQILTVLRVATEIFSSGSSNSCVSCADMIDKYLSAAVDNISNPQELAARQSPPITKIGTDAYKSDLPYNRALLGQLADLQCRALVNVIEDGSVPRLEAQLSGALGRWLRLQLPMGYEQAATFVQGAVFANRKDLLADFNLDLFGDPKQSHFSIRRAFSAVTLAGLLLDNKECVQDGIVIQIGAAIKDANMRAVAQSVAAGLEYAVVRGDEEFLHEIVGRMRGVGMIEEFHRSLSIQCGLYVTGLRPRNEEFLSQLKLPALHRSINAPGASFLVLQCLERAGLREEVRNWTPYHLRKPVVYLPVWKIFRDGISNIAS